jgi:hypothetical protein
MGEGVQYSYDGAILGNPIAPAHPPNWKLRYTKPSAVRFSTRGPSLASGHLAMLNSNITNCWCWIWPDVPTVRDHLNLH